MSWHCFVGLIFVGAFENLLFLSLDNLNLWDQTKFGQILNSFINS